MFIEIDFTMFPCALIHFEMELIGHHSSYFLQQNIFSLKFQTTLNQIHGESEDPGDICIDQGFTFTHSPLLSLAVIQGPFGLASNSCYSVGRFKHTQGCISNETPMASQGKAT